MKGTAMAREFLRLTPEATWGVFDNTQTNHVIVDLDSSNAFGMRPKPKTVDTRTAGAFNRRVKRSGTKMDVSGALKMIVRGSQATLLTPWIDAGGAARPSSMTIDHCAVREDTGATKVYRRYLGSLVKDVTFASQMSDQLLHASFNLFAKSFDATITASDFPEPAATDYASDAFFLYEHAGALTVGSSRTEFDKFQCKITNHYDAAFMNPASPWISRATYCGRDVDWEASLPYLVSIDRSNLESITSVSGAVTFTNGSHTLVFNMKSTNFYADVTDDFQLDKTFMQGLKMQAFYNASDATDFALTST
jgi:hypothetical protein